MMTKLNEIRADYDAQTITVYQAYSRAIAQPALQAQKFVAPFSMSRMTWIKPSFLWLMERSNWAQKSGQECMLAIRMRRSGWDEALSRGVLTGFQAAVHQNLPSWNERFANALVHVQWDPERSIRGADLGYNSIQAGLSRHLIEKYVDDWIVEIRDVTPLAKKIHALVKNGQIDKAKKIVASGTRLPSERGNRRASQYENLKRRPLHCAQRKRRDTSRATSLHWRRYGTFFHPNSPALVAGFAAGRRRVSL